MATTLQAAGAERDPRTYEQGGEAAATTSPPPEAQNQATAPPGNPGLNEDALRMGREILGQAGAGH